MDLVPKDAWPARMPSSREQLGMYQVAISTTIIILSPMQTPFRCTMDECA